MRRNWRILSLILVVLLLALPLAGCKKEAKLGSKENPIKMMFVPSGEAQAILASGQKIADMIQEKTGLYVEASVATSYAAVIEAMGAGKADVGWLNPFGYVLAHDKYGVAVLLITVRFGKPYYRGQIVVRADSGIKELKDLQGKKFAYVDPASTSGYLYPRALLKANGFDPDTFFGETVFAGSHNNVILAVYKGEVDAGATYDDARNAVKKDYPDVLEKVTVIAYTPNIPNDTVSVRKDLPQEIKDQLKQALLEISDSEEGQQALKELYSIQGLVEGQDAMFDPVRQAAKDLGIDLEKAVKGE